ncbi:HNH endonuclease, partial [Chamaesiphon sp. OTE_75_metabat_556]|uniref:HNH endonuclease n=1 Tax=Chamaesiphon sp. OTE_75_metabat_556 TaxID=2964692 RepID=UPI00286B5543
LDIRLALICCSLFSVDLALDRYIIHQFSNAELTTKLIRKAFPTVSSSEKKYVNVKGNKSPFDGDLPYWSERNSKLYNGHTSKALKRQNHSCASCGHQLLSDERVHLHHIDGNHDNWKRDNLAAIHESCHDYIHMSKAKV